MTFGDMAEIACAKKEMTSITPLPLLEVAGEMQESMDKFEKFSVYKFLDVLWEGIRHVQILADESNLEIPFLKELPAVMKVCLVWFPNSTLTKYLSFSKKKRSNKGRISNRRQAIAIEYYDYQQERLDPVRSAIRVKRDLIEDHLKRNVWILKDLVPPGAKITSIANLADLYLLTGALFSFFSFPFMDN